MKLVMYGAGSIGRGFIGALFAQGGYDVVFIDVNETVVEELNQRGRYFLHIAAETPYESAVSHVSAINGKDAAAVAKAIAGCDILATSLGAAVLPRVAPAIAQGLLLREAAGGGPLDILICENLKDAAARLREWLSNALPADRQDVLQTCGLVEAAIGRMVPVADDAGGEDPLAVTVEEYGFLPVDRAAFKNFVPDLPQLVPHAPFSFFEERKLYLHNMGHAVCAYLGRFQYYEYISTAIADPLIRLAVEGAMTEACSMLSARHGVPFEELRRHALDLLYRFGNPRLADTCARVARDPLRKLALDDRFAGCLRLCPAYGIVPANIAVGMAAAMCAVTADSAEADGLLRTLCGLDEAQSALVAELHRRFAVRDSLPAILAQAAARQHRITGKVV